MASQMATRAVQAAVALPKIVTGGLVLLAIGVMLYGVFMRYVMLPITDWLDVDPINFFWVEEVGETTLAWLTLIGAAVGVAERSHFTLTVLTHHLPLRVQLVIQVGRNLLIAAFGGLVAWLYAPAAVGGILMVLYALDAARRPGGPDHSITDVRE